MPGLTKAERLALPAEQFAVPGKRLIPLHDAKHVSMAWVAVETAKALTDAERLDARRRTLAAAAAFNVDMSGWHRLVNLSLRAMSLELPPADGHPNRMPFSGVLVRLDEPSDTPPTGSNGRNIIVSSEAARAALHTLLGMAVNTTFDFDGHYPQNKVGLITSADIVDGAIVIEGFLYAADFPETADAIRAFKDALGFSFEAQNIYVADPAADPLTITALVFTGASILRKDKAAFTTTSLAATADKGLTPMELKDLIDAVTGLTTKVDALATDVTAIKAGQDKAAASAAARFARADKLEAEAADLEKDGLTDAAAQLRVTVASLRGTPAAPVSAAAAVTADAIKAAVDAAVKPLADKLAVTETQLADVKASARRETPEPARKTLPPAVQALLTKAGVALGDDGKIAAAAIDDAFAKSGLTPEQRLQAKVALQRAGAIS